MFQSTCGYCKLQRFLHTEAGQQSMDDTSGKRISATHSVHYRIDIITCTAIEFLSVIYQCFPTVMRGTETFAQSAYDIFETESRPHSFKNLFISLCIGITFIYVCLRFETKTKLGILLISDTHIHILHQGTHDRLSLFWRPQFFAEIKVAANGNARLLCRNTRQSQTLCGSIADCGRNTTPMKPYRILKYCVEIKIIRCGGTDTASGPVINNFTGTQTGTAFQIINA